MFRLVKIMITCFILFLFSERTLMAQSRVEGMVKDSSENIVLYFRFNRSLLEKDYMTNNQSFTKLRLIMSESNIENRLDSILIKATASPDGAPYRNIQLSQERAAAVKTYLMWQYPFLDRNRIMTYACGENWEGLKEMVMKDQHIPYRDEILQIINSDNTPQVKDSKLRLLAGGKAFDYLTRNILRFLRTGTASISFYHRSDSVAESVQTTPIESSQAIVEIEIEEPVSILTPESEMPVNSYKRPIAFKTNLLFDAATLLNIGVEIPISRRFSISGELLFPWWLWENKQHSLEILSGTLEGRYWIKPRYSKQDTSLGTHNPLSGWFVGVYGNMGKYDLEWDRSGYQGEFYLSTGLSLGYVFAVRRNLNIELSLAAGYLQTDYRHYQACLAADGEWHLIK